MFWVFEILCILLFVLLATFYLNLRMICLCSFSCLSIFAAINFQTSCILGISLVCFVLQGFFGSIFVVFCLCFLFVFFGIFVFETSCILGGSLVCFVLLGFLGSIFVVFCLCFLFVFF